MAFRSSGAASARSDRSTLSRRVRGVLSPCRERGMRRGRASQRGRDSRLHGMTGMGRRGRRSASDAPFLLRVAPFCTILHHLLLAPVRFRAPLGLFGAEMGTFGAEMGQNGAAPPLACLVRFPPGLPRTDWPIGSIVRDGGGVRARGVCRREACAERARFAREAGRGGSGRLRARHKGRDSRLRGNDGHHRRRPCRSAGRPQYPLPPRSRRPLPF